jgi:hypothetical protein
MNKKKFKTGWQRIPRDKDGNLMREKAPKAEAKTEVKETQSA